MLPSYKKKINLNSINNSYLFSYKRLITRKIKKIVKYSNYSKLFKKISLICFRLNYKKNLQHKVQENLKRNIKEA